MCCNCSGNKELLYTILQALLIINICHVRQRWPPFPVNLRDWLPSDSRDRKRDAWAGVPVEYPLPDWY